MKHVEFSMTATDGLSLFGRRWLPDSGAESTKALICLVHGYGEHSGRYHHVAQALTDAGYAVIGIDLRGHGESDGPRGDTPSYNEQSLDDIGTLIETAQEQVPNLATFIYCHSMGGGMGMGYMLRRNPRNIAGVISSSPWLRLATAAPKWQATLVRVLARVRPSGTMSTKSKDSDKPITAETHTVLSRDIEMEERFRVDPHRHDTMSYRLLQSAAENGEWVLSQASYFQVPLLLIHGDADALTSCEASREFAKKAPRGLVTFKEWPGGYHELHNDLIREELFTYIVGWLDGQITT